MGKLRVEPIDQHDIPDKKRTELLAILRQAQLAATTESEVFWDMDASEDTVKIRKDFLTVAELEKIPVTIRRLRKRRCLKFEFKEAVPVKQRMSPEEAKDRILGALRATKRPMKKSEIVSKSGIKPTTWHLRISELLDAGDVRRASRKGGEGKPGTHYELAS